MWPFIWENPCENSQAIVTRESAGSFILPYSILLRTGFTWHLGRPKPGELLPHLFTLTLLRAVFFLWHFPLIRTNWALPSVLPCGARTFLTLSGAATRNTPSGDRFYHVLDVTSLKHLKYVCFSDTIFSIIRKGWWGRWTRISLHTILLNMKHLKQK